MKTAVVVDMVRTYNNKGYIFGRYVKKKPDPKKDIPYTWNSRLTLVIEGEVTPTAKALSKSLESTAMEIDKIPGSELFISNAGGNDTAEIRINVPLSSLGRGGLDFLIKHLHVTGKPTHLADWSEFHGKHATVPKALKDREPVPA